MGQIHVDAWLQPSDAAWASLESALRPSTASNSAGTPPRHTLSRGALFCGNSLSKLCDLLRPANGFRARLTAERVATAAAPTRHNNHLSPLADATASVRSPRPSNLCRVPAP